MTMVVLASSVVMIVVGAWLACGVAGLLSFWLDEDLTFPWVVFIFSRAFCSTAMTVSSWMLETVDLIGFDSRKAYQIHYKVIYHPSCLLGISSTPAQPTIRRAELGEREERRKKRLVGLSPARPKRRSWLLSQPASSVNDSPQCPDFPKFLATD